MRKQQYGKRLFLKNYNIMKNIFKKYFSIEKISILLLFLIFSLFFTNPLIFNLDGFSKYLYNFDWYDVPQYVYHINYFKESLLKFQFPIPIKKYFYPEGLAPVYGSIIPLYCFINAFLSMLTKIDEIIFHNIFIIFSVFLSGYAMYLLIHELTKYKISSIIGGLLFMTSSQIILSDAIIGHPDLVQLAWIPLIFLYLKKSIKNPQLRYGILLGFFGALQFLSSQQYTIYLTTILPLYLILTDYKIFKNKKFIKLCLFSISLFLIFTSWYMIFFIGKYYPRTIEENLKYSINFNNILDFWHPVLLLPSFIGIALVFKQKLKKIYPFFIIGIFTLFCSFGPFSNFAPYTILFNYWPFYDAFRTPFYMFNFMMIFICISVGLFFSYIYKKSKISTYFLFLFFIFILYFSRPEAYFYDFISYKDIKNEKIILYETISSHPEDFSIVEYPNSCSSILDIIFHKKNLIGGCATTPPETFQSFLNACGTEILNVSNENCYYFIKSFNIKYVIYNSEKYKNWDVLYEQSLKDSEFLKLEKQYKNSYIFRIEA
jgi:hypothetical protein